MLWSVVQLYAKCVLSLESAYYNEKVAMWEPLIEPVEHTHSDIHKPWQVTIEVCTVPCPCNSLQLCQRHFIYCTVWLVLIMMMMI